MPEDEELTESIANAEGCGSETTKKAGTFNSEKGREAALKRWSTCKFAKIRSYIKQTMTAEIEKRAEAIAKANAEFIESGNLEGVRAVQEGLKGIGAHAENEERAMNLNMKMKGEVKNSGTVKLVIEDMTAPEAKG